MNRFSETPRQTILAGAKKIAREKGLGQVNIRDVAKECGISVGSIYNSFQDKNELILGIVSDFWQGFFMDYTNHTQQSNSFYCNLENLYLQLARYLDEYEADWMTQLSYLGEKNRQDGMLRMKQCFHRVIEDINQWLNQDPTISKWEPEDSPINSERLAAFILDSILSQLRNGEKNPAFLLALLHRVLDK